MKILCFNVAYVPVTVRGKVKAVYDSRVTDRHEAAYAEYRKLTGANVKESWKVVKPWVRKWDGRGKSK